MNEIPHLDNAMWAFDDAGLPYPGLPLEPAPEFVRPVFPDTTLYGLELHHVESTGGDEDPAITIPLE